MRCPSCRSDNPERASFCGNCGARLSITCAGCGAVNLASVTFCTSCGLRLDARAAPSAAEARSPQAAARTRLPEDERKEVSVLFADISGSLGLIVDRDPETADAILSEIIAQLVDAVHRYGGTVNKMRGDGIMALFGAPVAQEDHAARACYAAMAMREIDHRRLRLISEGFDIPVKVRVGLNSGEAVVRKMSDDFAVGYDAVGEIVHLASRMEQTAAPGTIRLTAATLRLVPGLVETRPLGRLPIKGLAQPIEVHELAAIHAPPSSVRPLQRRELTRFVNREGELAGLDQALAEAAQGRGQLVALVGEAGFGKSRLLAEFVASSGAAAWRVLKGESYSYDKLTSYLPFVRIFRSFFGIGRNDDTAAIRAKVLAGLGALPAEPDRRHPQRAAAGKSRPAADPDPRGPALDRRGDAGGHRPDRREPAARRDPLHRHLSPRIPPWLGWEVLLPAVLYRPAARASRGPSPPGPDRQPPPGRAAEADAARAHGDQPVLSRGMRLFPRRRSGLRRRARRRSPHGRDRHSAHTGNGEGGPRRPHRPAQARREAHPPGGRGDRRDRPAAGLAPGGRLPRARAARGAQAPAGDGVPPRDAAPSRARVPLPPSPDPRGHLWRPAAGAAARAAHPGRRGDRDPVRGARGGVRREPAAPRGRGRGVGQGRPIRQRRRHQGGLALGQSEGRDLLRSGSRRPSASPRRRAQPQPRPRPAAPSLALAVPARPARGGRRQS